MFLNKGTVMTTSSSPSSNMPFIDLKTQYQRIKPQVLQCIDQVLEHGQYILGPEHDQLEKVLSDYVGCPHSLAVANGTDALLIPLMALGIGPGLVFLPQLKLSHS
jgi:UDP-2-acetamido-2-deoxy-ribo-hexuluronate aminotransferase